MKTRQRILMRFFLNRGDTFLTTISILHNLNSLQVRQNDILNLEYLTNYGLTSFIYGSKHNSVMFFLWSKHFLLTKINQDLKKKEERTLMRIRLRLGSPSVMNLTISATESRNASSVKFPVLYKLRLTGSSMTKII